MEGLPKAGKALGRVQRWSDRAMNWIDAARAVTVYDERELGPAESGCRAAIGFNSKRERWEIKALKAEGQS